MNENEKLERVASLKRRLNKPVSVGNTLLVAATFGLVGYFAFDNMAGALLAAMLAAMVRGTADHVIHEVLRAELREALTGFDGDLAKLQTDLEELQSRK